MNFYYRPNKFRNRKTCINGIKFDSQHEAEQYLILTELESNGYIRDLELQKKFELIPAQRINGKLAERSVSYIADFTYYDADNKFHVLDAKGMKTPEYIIKRKLMLYLKGIRIEEV